MKACASGAPIVQVENSRLGNSAQIFQFDDRGNRSFRRRETCVDCSYVTSIRIESEPACLRARFCSSIEFYGAALPVSTQPGPPKILPPAFKSARFSAITLGQAALIPEPPLEVVELPMMVPPPLDPVALVQTGRVIPGDAITEP